MKKIILLSVATAFLLVSFTFFALYGTLQSSHYARADEVPARQAEQMAHALALGAEPKALLPQMDKELFTSRELSLFILDSNGHVQAANTEVRGRKTPVPVGLLPHAKSLGLKQVTWVPWPGFSKALNIRYVPERDLYVAAAGTLDYSELPLQNIRPMILCLYAACIAVLALGGILAWRLAACKQRLA